MRIINQRENIDLPYDRIVLNVGKTSDFGFASEKPFMIVANEMVGRNVYFAVGVFDTYGEALDELRRIQDNYEIGTKIYRVE